MRPASTATRCGRSRGTCASSRSRTCAAVEGQRRSTDHHLEDAERPTPRQKFVPRTQDKPMKLLLLELALLGTACRVHVPFCQMAAAGPYSPLSVATAPA